MAWHDTLLTMKQELAEVRSVRQQRLADEDAELARERDELTSQAQTLGISDLLSEMNATLLEGCGELETIVGWDNEDTLADALEPAIVDLGADGEDDEDSGDVITTVLSWDEGGELEIAVDLGLSDEGTYLQINGIEIRPEREALEQGLVEAFRDELDL
jgi:hypothetical protein